MYIIRDEYDDEWERSCHSLRFVFSFHTFRFPPSRCSLSERRRTRRREEKTVAFAFLSKTERRTSNKEEEREREREVLNQNVKYVER